MKWLANFSLKNISRKVSAPAPAVVDDPRTLTDNFNYLSRGMFENGLNVEAKGVPAPRVNLEVDVLSGSDSDPPGQEGRAHFAEHISLYGTRELQDLVNQFRIEGGYANAAVEEGRIAYKFSAPAGKEDMMFRLAERMVLNHDIEPDQFEQEKEILTTEMNEKYDSARNDFDTILINRSLGTERPYNLINGGTPEGFQSLSLQDVQAFRRRSFVPSNMRVRLTGLDGADGYNLLKKGFGAQPPAPPPEPAPARTLAYQGGSRHIESTGDRQSYVGVVFPLPPKTTPEQESIISTYMTMALERTLRGPDNRHVYDHGAMPKKIGDTGLVAFTSNARPDKAGVILPAVAALMSDMAQGRIDPVIFKGALAQENRMLDDYKERQDSDPRGTDNPYERQVKHEDNKAAVAAVTPADLSAMARAMLAQPPTLVTKGDKSRIQSYEEFKAMLPLETANPEAAPVLTVT